MKTKKSKLPVIFILTLTILREVEKCEIASSYV